MVNQVTDEQRQAISNAYAENRAVSEYLEILEHNKRVEEQTRPKRGRHRTLESIQNRLNEIAESFESVKPLKRLLMIQERMNLEAELEKAKNPPEPIDITQPEDDFLGVAASFALRKGITYRAWRELGVEPSVLKQAGIRRTIMV